MRTQLFINTADNRTVPIVNNMFADNLADWVELNGVTPHYINNKLFVYNNESIQITQEINSNLGRYKVEINVCEIPGTTANAGAITAGFGDYDSYFDLVTNYNYSLGVNTFYVNVGTDATNCKEFLIALSGDFNQSISSVYVYDITEDYREVELYDDALIPLNFNILSITDLNSKKSNYSKTINIPGTKNNNIIFGHIYNVNNYGAFILNKPVKAYVIEDGLTYNFNFELNNCKTYLNKDTEYEGVLYSNLTDLYTKIGNKKIRGNENVLDDIDFSENDVVLNVANIEESWEPTNNSGVTFHMIDKFDKYSYPLGESSVWKIEEFTGALYIKEVFDKILNAAGYTYTSNFLNGDYFKRLILPNISQYNNIPSAVTQSKTGNTTYNANGFYGYELPLVSSGNDALLTYSQNKAYNSNIINQYNDTYLYKFSFDDASGALNSSAVNNTGYNTGILDMFMKEYTFNFEGVFTLSADITLSPILEFIIPAAGWQEDIGNPGNSTSRLYSDTSKIVKYELIFEHEGFKNVMASTEFAYNPVYDAIAADGDYFDNPLYYYNEFAQELYKKSIVNMTGGSNLYLEPRTVQIALGDKLYIREKITNPRYYTGTSTWIDKYWDWTEETWYNCNVIMRTIYGQTSSKGTGNTSYINIGGPTYSSDGTLVYANMLVPDMKQIDIIQNISKMFNLVWEDTDEKTFMIEPFNDFKQLEHTTTDITEYVDMSNDIEVSRSNFLNFKINQFAYTDDVDFFNEVYKTYENATYGSLNGVRSIVGKYNNKSNDVEQCLVTFAPTVCGDLVKTGSSIQVPKIFNYIENDWIVDPKSKFLPRILYFKGKVNQSGVAFEITDTNGIELASYEDLYPFTGTFDNIGTTGNTYNYDLNWTNNEYYWSSLPLEIQFGSLFNAFYVNRYLEMIDDTSYMIEVTAVLPSTFVHNFKFNDVVFFKDAYYYVNEIKNYIPGRSCVMTLTKQTEIDIDFTTPTIKPVIDIVDNRIVNVTTTKSTLSTPSKNIFQVQGELSAYATNIMGSSVTQNIETDNGTLQPQTFSIIPPSDTDRIVYFTFYRLTGLAGPFNIYTGYDTVWYDLLSGIGTNGMNSIPVTIIQKKGWSIKIINSSSSNQLFYSSSCQNFGSGYPISTESVDNDFFIFSIDTNNTSTGSTNNNQFQITFIETYNYNCIIDWGDGILNNVNSWDDPNLLHTYTTPGIYTIKIKGHMDWVEIGSIDGLKLLTVNQWGSNSYVSTSGMFADCSNMNVIATDAPNLSNATVMPGMFVDCQSFNADLSGWDVSNVTAMNGMFAGCSAFNSDLSSWDVSSVTNMGLMFNGCSAFNSDLSSWDVSNVTNMSYMFAGCSVFNSDLSSWDVSNVTSMFNMLNNSNISTANYDALLTGWLGWTAGAPTITLEPNVQFGVTGLTYTLGSDAEAARSYLINTLNWTITGDSGI